MVVCNDIANLFFVIINNISYNKIEVENIILKNENIFKKKKDFLNTVSKSILSMKITKKRR